MITYAYIDASNLFYGGKKTLGWSIDYEKLIKYLKFRFDASNVYYFGGIEISGYKFDYMINDTVDLNALKLHLLERIDSYKKDTLDKVVVGLNHHLKQVRFYQKLEKFGYQLFLKPVKIYTDDAGNKKRKANCDVEMTFYLMHHKSEFERIVILSGDGDFLSVLKYLRNIENKEIFILASGSRTSMEIRRFVGNKFTDILNLKDCIEISEEHI
ncbi:MAG: NYN domain-containing protein [bacterium]